MRISELQLRAFGPFTDRTLSFSNDGQGLFVLFGENEAGKSSALRALRDLLFGVPNTTRDHYQHGTTKMRIGAILRDRDGATLRVLRRKGIKDTLLDLDSEEPIDDGLLERALGNVSREFFDQFLGIDHDQLVSGSASLLAHDGEVGRSLFGAGLGAVDLRGVLDTLEKEAGELFKPSGSKPELNQVLASIKALRRQIKEQTLKSSDWQARQDALERAEAELNEVRARILARSTEQKRLQRQLQIHEARTEIERLETRLGQLSPDSDLLDHRDEIKRLGERLGSYQDALRDLPRVRSDRDEFGEEIKTALATLRPDLLPDQVDPLRPLETRRSRIEELIQQHAGIQARIDAARTAVTDGGPRLEAAQKALAEQDDPEDPTALRALLKEVRALAGIDARIREQVADLEAATGQQDAALDALPRTPADLDALRRMEVPGGETVDRFRREQDDLREALRNLDTRRQTLLDEEQSLKDDSARIRAAGDLPEEDQLTAERSRRDQAWRLIRRSHIEGQDVQAEIDAFGGEPPLPDQFETSLRRADEICDQLRHESDRHAEIRANETRVASIQKQLERIDESRGATSEQLEGSVQAWSAQWPDLADGPLPPAEMVDWIRRRDHILGLADRADELRRKLAGREQERGDLRRRVVETLGRAWTGSGDDLGGPLAAAESLLERLETSHTRHVEAVAELARQESALSEARRRLTAAEQEQRDWREPWLDAIAGLLPDGQTEPSDAGDALETLSRLFTAHRDFQDRERRVAGMERNRDEFERDVDAFVARHAPDLHSESVEARARGLGSRLEQATRDAARADQLETDLERHRERMQRAQPGTRAGSGSGNALETQPLVAELDPDQYDARIQSLETEISDLGDQREALSRQHLEAERQLANLGGAEAAAAATELQQELAKARSLAERYLRIHLARTLLEREIESFRAAHQGPLIQRASQRFAALTLDRYRGIGTDYGEKDRLELVALRGQDEQVKIVDLSDGTRDQLYLALRLAVLEDFLDKAGPVPFIVDDILVNFDDRRAEAVMSVLAELGQRTQVLLFTHHGAIRELAESFDSGVSVISLD